MGAMQKAGAYIFFALMTTACGVGSDGGGTSSDDPDVVAGITCRTDFKLTGTFVAGTPARPIDPDTGQPMTGCWPVGTWTFTATVDTEAMEKHPCATAPTPLAEYKFSVARTEDPNAGGLVESYTWMGDQASLFKLSVSEGGGGDCEGDLELYSADNTEYWNMHPALTDPMIFGFAEYAKFKAPQR